MKKREITIVSLVLWSLLIPQLHLIMNRCAVNKVDLILFIDVFQDIQWYIKDMCDNISYLLVYVALKMILPPKLKILGTVLIVGLVLDTINYWLFYHQYDWVYKSAMIIIALVILYINHEKRNNIRASS